MALLRVRIELKRDGKGIELPKLAELSREGQKLLRMVAEDSELPQQGTWVAQDFYNQGIGFDALYEQTDVDEQQANAYLRLLDHVVTAGPESNWHIPGVRPATLVQSARVAKVAGEHELVRLGVYNGGPSVQWKPPAKTRAEMIIEHFESVIEYRGMVQGIIHSLYKESQPPYFDIRDIASGDLIKCYYSVPQYRDVHAVLQRREAVVIVAGWIRAKRLDREIQDLRVEQIQSTDPLSQKQLESFFGSAPGWTGDLTTDDFIERARRSSTDGE